MLPQNDLNRSASVPSENVNSTAQPVQESRPMPQLDTVDRLSLWIVGHIALNYPEVSAVIARCDREAQPFFWEGIADAIRAALPGLDLVELRRMQEALVSKAE